MTSSAGAAAPRRARRFWEGGRESAFSENVQAEGEGPSPGFTEHQGRGRMIEWLSPAKRVSAVDWNAVYAEELPRIYNYFRYRVGDDAVAEDLTSTTFEKAWRNRRRYSEDLSAFSTWLFTIARNTAIDHFRRHRETVSLDAIADPPGELGVESLVQRRSDVDRLTGLLRTLSPRDRELVAMKYGGDLTNRQIAALTGLSESNVGTILYRLVGKLREQWEDEG